MSARTSELKILLTEALGRLSERERVSVFEVYVQGKTYEEAAASTGIPLGTLKRALRTGLQNICH